MKNFRPLAPDLTKYLEALPEKRRVEVANKLLFTVSEVLDFVSAGGEAYVTISLSKDKTRYSLTVNYPGFTPEYHLDRDFLSVIQVAYQDTRELNTNVETNDEEDWIKED